MSGSIVRTSVVLMLQKTPPLFDSKAHLPIKARYARVSSFGLSFRLSCSKSSAVSAGRLALARFVVKSGYLVVSVRQFGAETSCFLQLAPSVKVEDDAGSASDNVDGFVSEWPRRIGSTY